MKKIWVLLLFLLLSSHVFSQSRAWDIPESRGVGEAFKHGFIAGGEILLLNASFTFINWAAGWDWAIPSFDSIRFNFTNAWQWETDDGFVVNQLGHPFQGSLYFSAGRVNGFGFYQNVIFSIFGSATWDTSFENKHSSINDLFTTVPGAFAGGEISYRLYMEAYAAGVPAALAFILSPAAGLHRLLTNWEPPPANRNMYELRFFLGAAHANTHYNIDSSEQELFYFNGFFGYLGGKAVYGNPFEQDTFVPYRHFEFTMSYGMHPGRFHDIRMISDGYLFAFSPIYTSMHKMSTGLNLSMDFNARGRFHMHDSTINHYSNALNWTVKSQQFSSYNSSIQIKAHAGFTFLGASKYYSPEFGGELNNYGYGLNSKLFINIEHIDFGRLELDMLAYMMWNYPGTSALSHSTVYWLFSDISYSRPVWQRFSAGFAVSLAREWGNFDGLPSTRKRNNSFKLFVAWNM